jgi:DNA repair protein RecO
MEHCSCIVLSVIPFRETSMIVTLLSRTHGRVGGIAKGIRRAKRAPIPLERGQIIDLVLYYRPHRELHTMSQISIVNFFGATRSCLGKLAVRDAAFEIALKTLCATEAHPELFDFVVTFLSQLESAPESSLPLPLLWRFCAGWSAHLGFRINLEGCLRCKSDRILLEGGWLSPDQDGIICTRCIPSTGGSRTMIPATVLRHICEPDAFGREMACPVSPAVYSEMTVTGILADYVRYHFNIRGELKTMGFLRSILSAP